VVSRRKKAIIEEEERKEGKKPRVQRHSLEDLLIEHFPAKMTTRTSMGSELTQKGFFTSLIESY
jgi:hypothetical protein